MSHEWTPDYYTGRHVLGVVADSNGFRAANPCWPHDLLEAHPCATVGSFVATGSYAPFPYWSEGHSGYTTTMLLAGLPTWLKSWNKKATDVIIHAGINDIGNVNGETYNQATTMANFAAIKALIEAHSPGVRVWFVLLPPVAGVYAGRNANITLLNAALAAAYPSRTIDFVTGFNTGTMLLDDLHFSETGTGFGAEVAAETLGLAA
jgi:hypothetical protein